MKRDFSENFEDFLKRNADNLRMKAPDKIWQNVSNELNKKRRRFGFGLSAFLLATATLGYLTISNKQLPPTGQLPAAGSSGEPISQTAPTSSSFNNAWQEPVLKPIAGGRFSERLPGEDIKTSSFNATGGTRTSPLKIVSSTSSSANPLPSSAEAGTTENAVVKLPAQNEFLPTVIDELPGSTPVAAAEQLLLKPSFLSAHDAMPWSIESVTNSYHRKVRRFQTEFHFAPTVSYRKLSENKSYLRNASAAGATFGFAALYGSVNSMVTHKPDLGFEVGMTGKYSLSPTVRIKAGLQFNVNRYDIKAFNAPYALATIALNRRGSAQMDSLMTITSYSNVSNTANKSSWLQNLSFQVSAPVGIEMDLAGNDKIRFGIATTAQPTYVLGDRAYLITNDYKNYTQIPWLLRRWNVNTAFETFVSYQAGNTRWQVGPQMRYQLLSSFISNYPVKENLFDFGLKVGVSFIK